jgi:phosphoglycerate dehydrogenase-like enzyme
MKKSIKIFYNRQMKDYGLLTPELKAMIEKVDPSIKIIDASPVIAKDNLGDKAAKKELDAILAEAEIMYGFPMPLNLIKRAPKLKWIQSPLAGADKFMTEDFLVSKVVLTNSRGIADQVAEAAFMLAMAVSKKLPAYLENKKQHQWIQYSPVALSGKVLGVIGLGHIGSHIAQVGKAFRMTVIATEIKKMRRPEYVDLLLKEEDLDILLRACDFLIIAIPLCKETQGYIGKQELDLLKPSAYLINVARGGLVDEKALIEVLKKGKIAGAGIDVYEEEPLPASSPLWDLPNLIMTPHVAGLSENYDLDAAKLFCRNLRRYLAGRELINIVDKEKGY